MSERIFLSDNEVRIAFVEIKHGLVMGVHCPCCEAVPDQWCVTRNGRAARDLHQARYDAWSVTSMLRGNE